MPFLMVNLDDPADCRRAWEQLGAWLEIEPRPGSRGCRPGRPGPRPRGPGRHWPGPAGGPPPRGGEPREEHRGPGGPPPGELSLGQKLQRMRRRGIWQYLQQIATQVQQPLSLPELDETLGLSKNKMRSVKAILGKLERRWGLELLIPDPEGSVDAAGNPRYILPPRLRRKIIELNA